MNKIEAKGVSKSFGGVKAVINVDFDTRPGEIHAIIGENGAGKSTFIKMLSGDYIADTGEFFFDGKPVSIRTPDDATSLGIRTIYQEFNLVPDMSVAENIFLGKPIKKNGAISWSDMYAEAKKLIDRIGVEIDPKASIATLTVAEQQMVEICKALSQDSSVLILDEPTAALNDNEKFKLFTLVRQLAESGVSILYISHYLNEVLDISQRITVFRDGRKIVTLKKEETTIPELVGYIVGREMGHTYNQRNVEIGDVVLEAKSLTNRYLSDVSFSLRKGEIVGLYGLLGAGQLELCRTLFGDLPLKCGEIRIKGEKAEINNPIDAMEKGIAFVPIDRKNEGLLMNMSVGVNSSFCGTYLRAKGGVINYKKEQEVFEDLRQSVKIKTTGFKQGIGELSGGNQQKCVLARWMDYNSDVLILCDPSRGVDIGAKSEIYALLEEFCKKGKAVIMMSSDLPELLGVTDRLLLFSDGQFLKEYKSSDVDQCEVLNVLNGRKEEDAC